MATIRQRIHKAITDNLGVRESMVTPEANFYDDLDADSLDHVEMIMAIEDEFGIEIPDSEVEKIKTVQDLYNSIIDQPTTWEVTP